MSLTAHSRRGIWRVARKSTQNLAAYKQTANCVSTLFSEAQKQRNKRELVKIHSSLVVFLLKFGSKLRELDLASVWVTFLRKPLTVRVGLWPDQSLLF